MCISYHNKTAVHDSWLLLLVFIRVQLDCLDAWVDSAKLQEVLYRDAKSNTFIDIMTQSFVSLFLLPKTILESPCML